MGPGGPRGLQIPMSGVDHGRGGFDSHTFPPAFSLSCKIVAEILAVFFILIVLCDCENTWAEDFTFKGYAIGIEICLQDTTTTRALLEERDKARLKDELKLIALEEVEGEKRWQRKKTPLVAVFSNMVLPGLGEVYNGRRLKAALMVGLSSFYVGEAWLNYKRSVIRRKARDSYPVNTRSWYSQNEWFVYHKEQAKDYLWWSGAVWVIGMLDAYIDAHLFDLRGFSPEKSPEGTDGTRYFTLSMSF
jgi:hypothetical protein